MINNNGPIELDGNGMLKYCVLLIQSRLTTLEEVPHCLRVQEHPHV